jgi:hypothetical protein
VLTGAAALVMAPVLLHPTARVIGWPGDNVQYAYMGGWVADALRSGRSPFIDQRVNPPSGLALATTDFPYVGMVATAPLAWSFGPTFAYNALLFFGLLLSGLCAYLWVRRVTGSLAAGLIAGLAFTLTPYLVTRVHGHTNQVSAYGVPLFFWALDRAVRRPAPHVIDLLLLGGAAFLAGAASQVHALVCLVTAPFYAAATTRPRWLVRHGWEVVIAMAVGAWLSARPYLAELQSGTLAPYPVQAMREWSVDPISFLMPSRLHPLWGALVDRVHPDPLWVEKTLYVGAVPLALAAWALVWPGSPYRRLSVTWSVAALAAAVFALGTDLRISGAPVAARDPVWLPSYYLAQLPLFGLVRVWARFGVVTSLFVALLAGLGAARILRASRWGGAIVLLAGTLLLVDLFPATRETTPLAPRPIDRWLKEQPGEFSVAFLPARSDAANYLALFGSLHHGKTLPGYVHPTHQPEAYRAFAQAAAQFPSPSGIDRLAQLGLRYLILERARFDGRDAASWSSVASALGGPGRLRIITEVDGFVVAAPS